MRKLIASIEGEFRRYKKLGDETIAQLQDNELTESGPGHGNSIAVLVWHLSGNFISRFTDFLTSDGEKPWRNRDSEFETLDNSRKDLEDLWVKGWGVLEDQLARLTDQDLLLEVVIRGEAWSVHGALARSLAHASYHVGQMVTLARLLCSSEWQWITIPKGKSREFNANPRDLKLSGDKAR